MFRFYFNRVADVTFRQLLQHIAGRHLRLDVENGFNALDQPCIFVLSTGRVGTKTLAALAGLTTRLVALHEPTPKLYGLSAHSYRISRPEIDSEILVEAFLTARRDRFRYALSFGKGYVETSPQVTFLAPVIRVAVPEARFIHVVRDPRAFVCSGMRRGWYVNHPMDGTRLKPLKQSEDHKFWRQWGPFEKICWLWKETNLWIYRFMQSLPADRKLFLHSEDMFLNKKEDITKFFGFLNARIPADKTIKKILSKKLNAQISGDFLDVSDWTDEMHTIFYRILGESAKQFGYQN
jgi:hypothetical protein